MLENENKKSGDWSAVNTVKAGEEKKELEKKLEKENRSRAPYTGRQFVVYIIAAFGIAYLLQVVASVMAMCGSIILFQIILSISMFSPMLAMLIARKTIKGIGWNITFKGNMRYILATWFLPTVLTGLGAVLFFVIFPESFDLTGKYLIAQAGQEVYNQMIDSGITIPMYVVISSLQTATIIPVVNAVAAIGEEVGWRGFMYRYLKEKFGTVLGRIIGGVIWGAWHFPVIMLAGYEYGTEYMGYPLAGPFAFLIVATILGIILDHWYERTGSIIVPAIGHGAINGAATIPLILFNSDMTSHMILGPSPVGLVAVIPMALYAVYICIADTKKCAKN